MRRTLYLSLLFLVLLTRGAGAQDTDLLSPEEAFRMHAGVQGNTVEISWDIADGYYMYRDRIQVRLVEPAGATLGPLSLPAGETKDDPSFGEMEVYHGGVQGQAPVNLSGVAADSVKVEVQYQGCAEAGVCYPPLTQVVDLPASAAPAGAPGSQPAAPPAAASPPANEQGAIAALLRDTSALWVSLSFVGFGLLLAFTPCVLPMVPILSGLIVGSGGAGWRRGLALSAAYVLPMAVAYAGLGVLAALAGENLQAAMQAPWVIGAFSAIFVVLGLSMLGFFTLQVPAGIQTRLTALSNRQRGGTLLGAVVMGLLSALIVGPCLTAPLAGALLYIGQTGDAALGALALFSLGLGMGLPLLLIGAVGARFLPSAGTWMDAVKALFGFVLLGVAVWMLERVLPAPVILLLWAALLVAMAVCVRAFARDHSGSRLHYVSATAGVLALGWAAVLLVGAAAGGEDPLRPLAAFASAQTPAAEAARVRTRSIDSYADLEAELAAASRAGKPVLVDFYADWCVSCKVMEHEVFPAPSVSERLSRFVVLKPDITANDPQDRELMRRLRVLGPPTFLFFNAEGDEMNAMRIVGEMGAASFAAHLDRVLGAL